MSLPRPTATITLDGQELSSAEAGLAGLRLDLGFNTHDRAQLTLWPRSKLTSAAPGSELVIGLSTEGKGDGLLAAAAALGGGGGDNTVWTGTVQSVQSSSGWLRLTGLASTAQLSNTRRSATWSEQTVEDIVRDLAGDLDSEIEADLELPNFNVDNSRPVWAHLYELAQLSGAQLSCAPGGGVRFIFSAKADAPTELRYGAELIDWRLSRNQAFDAVGAAEHAAASSAGNDKWHWLAHDPVGANADAALIPASYRTRTAAEKFTEAANARAQRATVRGEVWTNGHPQLRPGMLVQLKNLPEGDSDSLRIRAVTHQLDGDNGFITALAVEGSAEGSGLVGGL
jgi:hypothetical protein